MTIRAAGISLNYKCNPITDDTIPLLAENAKQQGLDAYIQDLLQGNIVNLSENRAAWHTALRDPHTNRNDVSAALEKIATLCETIQDTPITDIVHLGVGGSFWGPKLALEALKDIPSQFNVHFVAELDELELQDTLATLKPAQTLFIVVSKSFDTAETLINANRAKKWLLENSPELDLQEHFIAVTKEIKKAQAWCLDPAYILPMWDWVGGRTSVMATAWAANSRPACSKASWAAL